VIAVELPLPQPNVRLGASIGTKNPPFGGFTTATPPRPSAVGVISLSANTGDSMPTWNAIKNLATVKQGVLLEHERYAVWILQLLASSSRVRCGAADREASFEWNIFDVGSSWSQERAAVGRPHRHIELFC